MGLARAWHQFRDAEPGHRFHDVYDRLRRTPRTARVALWLAGLVLIAGGVVLLFIPGPGIIAIVLGLALLTGLSRRLADVLDDGEKNLRAWRNEP
jgi:UPF0716 family protein affecting phage T7 exclusion